MKRKILSKTAYLIIILSLTVSLCGCGSAFDLSKEESRLIAEYAAGLILKYSNNYSESLVKYYDQPDDELVKRIQESEIKKEEALIAEEAAAMEEVSSSKGGKKDTDTIYTTKNIAESIGLDGFVIDYKNYEIVDSYPKDASDMAFTLDAAPGKHLLVMHFDIKNTSGGDKECDVLSENPTFRIVVNGKNRINEQQTILLDDLKQFKSNVSNSADAVLLFELDEELSDSIERIDLTIKSNGEQNVHKIL